MSDYPKNIHECIKRTLIFSSGKKIDPISICFVNNYLQDSPCSGTSSLSEEEQREIISLVNNMPNGSRCLSCPFLKVGEYVSDALRMIKTFGLVCAQDKGDMNSVAEMRKSYFCSCVERFLRRILDKVRIRCYLTFSESDKKNMIYKINEMSFNELFHIIDEMEKFCKENNIK